MTNDEKNLQIAWHALEVEEVLRDLQVHENGLTAKNLLNAYCVTDPINYRKRRVPFF